MEQNSLTLYRFTDLLELNAMETNQQPRDDFFSDMEEDIPSTPATIPARSRANRFEKRTPTDRAETLYSEPCTKCRGTGFIGAYAFREQGRCYQCDGKGVLTFKTPKAVRDANKIKSAERRERKMVTNLEAFESENPQIAAWWANSTFEFANSLKESVRKYGSLTAGQLAAALRCVEKFGAEKAAKEAQSAARAAGAKAVDISPIAAAFERAKRKGLRHPKMYLLGGETKLVFSRAPDNGKNAGAVYVKANGGEDAGTYLGKVQHGKFFSSRECTPSLAQAVEAACADPENAAIAYGKKFGVCSCCGRDLTDPDSVARGIGPVCANNFFG